MSAQCNTRDSAFALSMLQHTLYTYISMTIKWKGKVEFSQTRKAGNVFILPGPS